jgi:hypothetical protein
MHVGIIGGFGDVPDRRVCSESEDRKSICLRVRAHRAISIPLLYETTQPRRTLGSFARFAAGIPCATLMTFSRNLTTSGLPWPHCAGVFLEFKCLENGIVVSFRLD